MKIKIWNILTIAGVALSIGTIGSADAGAIGTAQIVIQLLLGLGLIAMAYITFISACNRRYGKR